MYWFIVDRNSARDHRNIKGSKLSTYISFYILMITWWWINHILYNYVDLFNGSLIVWWLFKNQDFVRRILKLLSVVDVNWSLVTWKAADRILLIMLAKFSRWAKNIGCKRGSKSKVLQSVYKIECMYEIPRKKSSLNLKWSKTQWKLTSINCDLIFCHVIIFMLFVGW